MSDIELRNNIKEFVDFWTGKGYEKGQSQTFWLSFLSKVLGVKEPEKFIEFEDQVHIDKSTGFIDAYIPETKVLIEQKAIDKDLRKAVRQSDGSLLTPFQQAKKYIAELPVSKHPKWVITCNFKSFLIYNMEKPNSDPEEILLKDLPKEYYRLQFIVNKEKEHLKKEMEISIQAGELVGKIYDEILPLYKDPENENTLRSLNMLCVRLVFCLYAEDAGLFGKRLMFHDYLNKFSADDLRRALIDLFRVLDTKVEDRDPYMKEELSQFPYVNGGLFADENIEIPMLNEKVKELLLTNASEDFDWSDISPTIFGAVFESTLNPETRRSGGMHYTSIENIHKVIDPLFLNELQDELEEKIMKVKTADTIKKNVALFQDKISKLKFLDPACGSGNFLTETYLSLRKMENKALEKLHSGQIQFGDSTFNPIKVSISQFYGIEINDFAVTVAKTALWIAESQMMKETENILHLNLDFLPLKSYTNIIEANALKIDWNDVIPNSECNYIMGNPPFVGARIMSDLQKEDVFNIFGKISGSGDLDYVACWYKKSAEYIKNTIIECALVSTNSISQGVQVAILWENLINNGLHINFAYKTFIWDSEATLKAHVHCVIIGFSYKSRIEKMIFDNGRMQKVPHINAYLLCAPNIFIKRLSHPICDVPEIYQGVIAVDNGNLCLTQEERDTLIKTEPNLEQYIHLYIGTDELLNNKNKYCLWLRNITPEEIRKSNSLMKRLEKVKEFREKSNRINTKKNAATPHLFEKDFNAKNNYIAIPRISSERRKYIPMCYLEPYIIPNDKLFVMEDSSLYDFGILESNVHTAWVKVVCGRLKSDPIYSNQIVYNNFPWPTPTEEQKLKIEKTAQMILDARAKYPNSSLADLYDELTMPPELRKAHQMNDIAVYEAYGKIWNMKSESDCVAKLMEMHQKLINK